MPNPTLAAAKTPARYLPGLDVVRLAALLPVLCYHFCAEAATRGFALPAALLGQGMAAWVEVGLAWFFLLSGAALCLQWRGRFAWRPYLVGRAAAMYPAFWLGFGALFLYGEILHGNNAEIPKWRVIFSVLGLDGYLSPLTPTFYKIGEWFLGVILLLYLLFPLLLRAVEAAADKTKNAALRWALVGGGLALQFVWPLVCPAPLVAGHTVLGRLPVFALGVWFGTLLPGKAGGEPQANPTATAQPASRPAPRWHFGVALGAALGVALLACLVPGYPGALVLGCTLLAALLFWPLYRLGQRVPQRAWGALRRAAGLCYGVYLVHHVLLTLVLLPLAARLPLPLAAWFALYLAAAFALAAVLMALAAPISRMVKK